MTEQEKREKAIEEMARDLCGETNCCACHNDWNCEHKQFASKAVDYILCKEEEVRKECDKNAYNAWKGMFGLKEKAIREEVRKETAKEIFTKLIDACRFDGHTVNLFQSEIVEFAKEFGVEVEG